MLIKNIDGKYSINELEISITSKCHLSCFNCGFNIPYQPYPSNITNTIQEMCMGLEYLLELNIEIKTLVILGGEPSFNSNKLVKAINEFSKFSNINSIEVVTHGLTPQNIKPEVLQQIDKLAISVYFKSDDLILLWKKFIKQYYPMVELNFRINKQWDKWLGDIIVSDNKAQELFTNCWYKKHCITLERNKLFICSRIPKMGLDNEGLDLNNNTTIIQVENYLNRIDFLNACKNCIPMMNLEKIEAGQQPDTRVLKMIPTAIKYLQGKVNLND